MKISAKYCLNYKSSHITWVNPQMWSLWICHNCFYPGPVVLEDEKLAYEIQEKYLGINNE